MGRKDIRIKTNSININKIRITMLQKNFLKKNKVFLFFVDLLNTISIVFILFYFLKILSFIMVSLIKRIQDIYQYIIIVEKDIDYYAEINYWLDCIYLFQKDIFIIAFLGLVVYLTTRKDKKANRFNLIMSKIFNKIKNSAKKIK
ncbi:TPA: hypothetical protein RPW15_001498 [Campylobacter fetus subsp. venerealis]|nr:hypothetical protein [Campylobacter fetus subsp. venerealis]HDX6283691.1 hypothetical protein [Campylobacter fetus subsp. venerealis]HDX6285832.1 hypothetical protein [Campylobacter fetus subsp. venerealis]HDX6287796.1 hypothetical protein [Campylobacter fetus subsp. venerealis]HDX6289590.1 hypothetical protein [Campylobacter fetus subsp. venerealis]